MIATYDPQCSTNLCAATPLVKRFAHSASLRGERIRPVVLSLVPSGHCFVQDRTQSIEAPKPLAWLEVASRESLQEREMSLLS